MWQRLVAEHGATVAEGTGSRYVAARRVDFGEFETVIAGMHVKVWMFVMRLSHSGRAFHVAYGTQAQEAFSKATSRRSSTSAGSPPGCGTTT